MTKADRDEARYLPVETQVVWCFQVEVDNLEKLSACMEMLVDYGYRLTAGAMKHSGMLAIVDEDGRSQSVGHLDWIVFEGGEVKTVARQAFNKDYRKMTREEKA